MLDSQVAKYIIENMASGACYVQPDETVAFWNKSAEELTGLKSEDIVGKPFPKNSFSVVDSYDKELLKTKAVYDQVTSGLRRLCLWFNRCDNKKIAVRILVVPVAKNAQSGWMVFMDHFADVDLDSDRILNLHYMAGHDALTGLPNRRIIESKINEQIAIFEAGKGTSSIFFADIDYFRRFNDIYGHEAGDRVLSEMGALIREEICSKDCIGRWGGEEFVGVVPIDNEGEAVNFAEHFRKLVSDNAVEYEDKKLSVTISIGVTLLKEGDDLTSVVRRVDKAMYHSKENGRNCVTLL